MIDERTVWLLVVIAITAGVLFAGSRFGGLTLDKFRPWGAFIAVAGLGAWVALKATRSPHADFIMAFLLSFVVTVEWIAWFERRSQKTGA
jgi:hypothetical protein